MKIVYNEQKDQANMLKHGCSLATAKMLEWDTLWSMEDLRHNYGETRMIGFALIDVRAYCVVFSDRGDTRRIISLRKANKREVKRYADHI